MDATMGPNERPDESQANNDSASVTSSSDEESSKHPTNERLLSIAFVSFLSFALLQVAFALMAGSTAMLGDSCAMIVDSMTYVLNWFAERRKKTLDFCVNDGLNDDEDPEVAAAAARLRKRNNRKTVCWLEIVPPMVSVSTLIIVTILIIKDSVITVMQVARGELQSDPPNIPLMFGFSTANLALDLFNVFCFSRAKYFLGVLRGYSTVVDVADCDSQVLTEVVSNADSSQEGATFEKQVGEPASSSISTGVSMASGDVDPGHDGKTNLTLLTKQTAHAVRSESGISAVTSESNTEHQSGVNATSETVKNDLTHHGGEKAKRRGNLNMCSAYTHVFADTLRSIAVLIAAVLALIFPVITPEEADSSAALIVSLLILLSLIPLFQGVFRSGSELHSIRMAERAERENKLAA